MNLVKKVTKKMKKILKTTREYLVIWSKSNEIPLNLNKILLLTVVFSLSSCYTSKKLNYLQSDQPTYVKQLQRSTYRVQPNDILSVKVQSRDPEQSIFFNLNSTENRNLQANPASLFLTGYTVDQDGVIDLAIIGETKVGDLTVEEIRDLVQLEIDKYLLNATVSVVLTSFKVSVLGDVRRPGINYIYNGQATIFEALSASGDLNLSAKRKNIKLIRQIGNETLVTNLDLTSPSIIESPYYFLHPNDVIYVDTSKPNIGQSNLSVFSLILSAITTTVLVLNFTTNN